MIGSQLVFDLEPLTAWNEADFFIAKCNENAVRLVQSWPSWGFRAAILYGPSRSGKSHLARIWQTRTGGRRWLASGLCEADLMLATQPAVIEDVDRAAVDERVLFHRLNLTNERKSFTLLTGLAAPGDWNIALPDLKSRIRSFPAIEIGEPDEELLSAVLLKHFSDRQLSVSPEVIPYIVSRMERSMAAAHALVCEIDNVALSERRRITKPLVARVLEQLGAADAPIESI